jgi:PAP2 superfamily
LHTTALNLAPLRRSEWICLAYFAYVTSLAFFIKVPARRRVQLLLLNVSVAIGLFLLPGAVTLTSKLFVSVVRDWIPAPLILLGYWQAGLLTLLRPDQFFEKAFLRWDEHLFRIPALSFLSPKRRLPSWVEALLEFSYLQCYVIVPSGIAVLYLAHRGRFSDQYWSAVLPAIFIAYGLTPLFPAQPPRKLEEAFSATRDLSWFRKLNLWVHDHASIKFSTFPSGLVVGAVSTAWR